MKAIDYIRKGWTQNSFARDNGGDKVSMWSNDAICWCASAAIYVAYVGTNEVFVVRNALHAVIGDDDIVKWNDAPGRTQDEVIAAFEQAGI